VPKVTRPGFQRKSTYPEWRGRLNNSCPLAKAGSDVRSFQNLRIKECVRPDFQIQG
jgi:hypothetical protein